MIYAVDFDGTLCENKWPKIGDPNRPLIDFLIKEQIQGARIILWTMRDGLLLKEAVAWLAKQGLAPDMINDNDISMQAYFGNNPRKVYADVYIDDHNAKFGVTMNLPYKSTQEKDG